MGATTAVSYIFGLLRDRLLAQLFGASQILGAYEASFILPDLILNIFVAGALTAAFIPIFSNINKTGNDNESSQFISSVINGSLLVVLVSGIVVFFFAPYLAKTVVPGFYGTDRQIFINLVRLLLISPIIFAVSNTLGNILLSKESFFWYGISASLYNIGTILGIIFLIPRFGIYGVAIGSIGGAVLHLASRIIGYLKYHLKYRPTIKLDIYYKRFLRLMSPKMIQHPIEELTFWGFTAIASSLTAGSIVILNFARNFQSMPVNTIGLAFALAVFPKISKSATDGDGKEFVDSIRFATKSILITTIPVSILIYLFKIPIISIILGGGAFSNNAVILTAATLGIFTLSIPTESMAQLLARAFYSLRDSLTPAVTSILALVLAVISGYFFSRFMGVKGLALGYFLGSLVKIISLYILLKMKNPGKLPEN